MRRYVPLLHTLLSILVVDNDSFGIATLQHVFAVQKHWEFVKV